MDTLNLLVTALSVGAAAGLQNATEQVVKEVYQKLKSLLAQRYPAVHVDLLETAPTSEARKAVIREELEQTDAAGDRELVLCAQSLLRKLNADAFDMQMASGVSLEQVRVGASARIEDIDVQAPHSGSVSGVHVKDVKVKEDLVISKVKVSTGKHTGGSEARLKGLQPVRILFLAANPNDVQLLNLAEESRLIARSLRESPAGERFQVTSEHALRPEDIHKLLLHHKPDIVHFSGHGESGEIVLMQDDGYAQAVSSAALGRLFGTLSHPVQCVVLNACFSALQVKEMRSHVGCLIGTGAEIGDRTAIAFADAFYRAVAYGENVATAFEQAVAAVDLQGFQPADMLKLLSGRTVPNEIVFGARPMNR